MNDVNYVQENLYLDIALLQEYMMRTYYRSNSTRELSNHVGNWSFT